MLRQFRRGVRLTESLLALTYHVDLVIFFRAVIGSKLSLNEARPVAVLMGTCKQDQARREDLRQIEPCPPQPQAGLGLRGAAPLPSNPDMGGMPNMDARWERWSDERQQGRAALTTRRSIMTLRKTSISLGSAVAVVRCGITRRHRVGPRFRGGGKYFGCIDGFGSVNRAPQPNLRLPGAASRPSNRDLRTRPIPLHPS